MTALGCHACSLKSLARLTRLWCLLLLTMCAGCGTTKQHTATEQLLASDAVDVAVAKIDFTPLAGQRIYFDTKYIKNVKGPAFVNADYVISALRQQMIAAGVLLYEAETDADFVVEARVGALGADSHEVVYGLPSTNSINAATTAVAAMSQVPAIPTIPELSLARKNVEQAAAKIGVFAYERETRQRIWQSGLSIGHSQSKDLWVFGAGPFQRGTIHDGQVRFAGSSLDVPLLEQRAGHNGPIAAYRDEALFQPLDIGASVLESNAENAAIQQVSGEQKSESE